MLKPWKETESATVGDYRIFKSRRHRKVSPRTGQTHDFYTLDSPDWVNVIALTPDQKMVLVEQYRHGTERVELEIPGGLLDPGEAPVPAGLRELREETGYEGEDALCIGVVRPNPAFMNNTCSTVLVRNAVCKHPLEWDHSEELITRLVPVDEVEGLVASGVINHAIIVAALYYFRLWRQKVVQ